MGAGKKQTIGYRYYIGLHLVLCRQADALLEIKMATKRAWRGALSYGRGSFNRPNLFGGDKREGGISGSFDFMQGGHTQPVNDYLAGILHELTSAYRGVVSIVFRRPYIVANSARLPNMSFKLLNISNIHKGWYADKAPINVTFSGKKTSIYIAWNVAYDATQSQLDAMKLWLTTLVNALGPNGVQIYIQRFTTELSANVISATLDDQNFQAVLDAIAIQPLIDTDLSGQCDLANGLEPAVEFFDMFFDGGAAANFLSWDLAAGLVNLKNLVTSEATKDSTKNIVIILGMQPITPGSIAPSQVILNAIPDVEVYSFEVDNSGMYGYDLVDNTPVDGVPMIDTTQPITSSFLTNSLMVSWADVNPAHIIRCLWTDPMRGGIADISEIDDENFREAADLFYSEKLGLSPRFRGVDAVEADRVDVERHADCISYRSRENNKIRIKPVRNDYNPVDLPVLDSSIVMDWGNLERSQTGETPNQLTVIYTKRANGETASVTRTNIAGVRRSGRVIPGEPVEYLSCTVEELAVRLCLRDLSIQHKPLLTGPITLAYLPPNLDIGEPFIINEPKLKIENVVVRITEINENDGIDNSIIVTIAEDHFALPSSEAAGPGSTPPTIDEVDAMPCPNDFTMEAPYYFAVLDQGQEIIDQMLTDEPDLGIIMALGDKPTSAHRNITVGIDDGSGFFDAGEVDFAPSTQIADFVSNDADATIIKVYPTNALEGVAANSLAIIDNEIVRIDAFTENGDFIDITVARGCLDTVPDRHYPPANIAFLHLVDPLDSPTFISGNSVDVKLLTNTTSSRLNLFLAPQTSVVFDSRAIRPYPPGALAINGSFTNDQFYADAVLEWAHRDRTAQTTLVPEAYTDGDIGPEPGTSYTVVAEALNENYEFMSELVNVNVGSDTTYDWDDATALPLGTNAILFRVISERDGYQCWQTPSIIMSVLLSPYDLSFESIVDGVRLTWADMNTGAGQEDDILIYRDTAPFDLSSLPVVMDTLAADTESYDDLTAVSGTSYYYAVVMHRGALMSASFTGEVVA